MCKIATTPIKMNPSIWNQSTKSRNEEILREELMKFIPRDIIKDYDENCKSIQMDITKDTISQASDSTKSDVSESNLIVEFLTHLWKWGKKGIWYHISSQMLYKYYLSDA